MSEKAMQETKEAVNALRETVEKFGTESAEFKQMIEKTDAALEAGEKRHEQVVASLAEANQKALDADERLQDFEKQLSNYHNEQGKKGDYKETPEFKALVQVVQFGEKGLSPEQAELLSANQKTMRMDGDPAGGYLTTVEMDTAIIKGITEISPVRQVARVRSVSKKTLEMPVRKGIPTATYEGETQAGGDSESNYGNEQLTTHRLTTTVPFTMDLLGDSSFDLVSEINGDVNEAFAYKEGNKFVTGSGAKEPEGFLQHAVVAADFRESASANVVTGDDLLLMTGDLKAGYNPMFGFNRQTLAYIRTLKGSNGQYLWQQGLAADMPNTIGGEAYVVMQDMPAMVAGALAVVYADFMRGYTITDRTGMMIIRDDYSKKRQAIIEMTFHRWNTGQVTLAEAFKLLKIKA